MDTNISILIGHMSKNAPVTRFTSSGRNVCTFQMATNRQWNNADGTVGKSTQWHTVTAWSKLGEIVQKWAPGGRRHVCVEGRIEYERFTDKEGVEKFYTKIVAKNVSFLDKKPPEAGTEEVPAEPEGDPDIAF